MYTPIRAKAENQRSPCGVNVRWPTATAEPTKPPSADSGPVNDVKIVISTILMSFQGEGEEVQPHVTV